MLSYEPDDDISARRVIDQRIHTNSRDDWADLIAPEYIEQTYRILVEIDRVTVASLADKKWAATSGEISEAEHTRWRRRAVHFRDMMLERKQFVRSARAQLADKRHYGGNRLARIALLDLARAVQRHQETTAAEFKETDADRELWNQLDTLRVPHHGEQRSLTEILAET